MFSIVDIRPHIVFSIVVSVCFTKNPSHSYFKTVKSILCYLKGSINCRITYDREKKQLSKDTQILIGVVIKIATNHFLALFLCWMVILLADTQRDNQQ